MYEVKAALESLAVGEEGETGYCLDRGGHRVLGVEHQVQCRGHQGVVQAVYTRVPSGVGTYT